MEIVLLPKSSLRIKGKRSSFVVDTVDSGSAFSKGSVETKAVIVLTRKLDELDIQPDLVVINGPGEYEVGGMKINASRLDGDIIYNPNVDGVEIVLGKISTLEKMQHKLKEQHIVIAYVDAISNASFITSLASNVVIFYGERAPELAASFGQENVAKMSKYSTTLEKLPQEVETIILE